MCGIVGAFAFGKPDVDKEKERIRQEAIIFLTTELLQKTQSRGEDATGIATLFDNGMYFGLKAGTKAVNFISSRGGKETDYAGYLKIWRHKLSMKNHRYAKIHIGHCRKSSVGNSQNNDNNHPIVVDPIIGIHNGTLKNHDLIFKKLGCERTGSVDSEAIMRLMYHYTNAGKLPFTVKMLEEVGNRLEGSFATIIINANNPYQAALMRDMRPVEMLLIRPLNLVLIASETKFFDVVMFRYNKYVSLYSTDNRFPLLKKGDLDDEMLANDGLAVFDLTREINSDTKLKDLYDGGKLAYGSRIWKTPYKATSSYYGGNKATSPYYSGNGAYSGACAAHAVANKSDNASNTKKSNTTAPAGKVWNKKLNAFEPANVDVANTKDKGNVTVNVETGEVEDRSLTKVDNADKVLITSVPAIKVENLGTTDGKNTNTSHKDAINAVVVEEVDMTVNPKALEEAETAAKTVKQYDTDAEITSDLELSDEKVLRNLPVVSLANRIKKFIYKLGFYDGYCKAEELMEPKGKVRAIKDLKARKQEKNIRVLKTMTKLIGSITDEVVKDKRLIRRALITHYSECANKDITMNNVMKVFKAGDIRNSTVLKEVVAQVQLEESKK